MNQELVTPNLHVAIVHFPIALLIVGVLLEFFSFLGWRRSGLRVAARWMILLGAMLGVPVALSGTYALSDVREAWPIDTERHEEFFHHVLWSSLGAVISLLTATLWIALSDHGRRLFHWPATILLLLAVSFTARGASFGGHVVYEHGVGVRQTAIHGDEPPGEDGSAEAAATQPTTAPAPASRVIDRIAAAAPPLQTHTVFAGLAIAFAVVSLGISSRAMLERRFLLETSSIGDERTDGDVIASSAVQRTSPVEAYRHLAAAGDMTEISGVRAAPIAFLATLFGLCAAVVGLWFLAHDGDTWQLAALWNMITDRTMNDGRLITRRMAHLILGVSIVVLPLLVLAITRIAPRARLLWLILSLLLLAVVAGQVWLGVLMMFDEERAMGPITVW